MKIFPASNYSFKIIGEQTESLERLKRRTQISESLSSKITDKSFLGTINNNSFKIISTEIGKGAFCVLNGEVTNKNGTVNVEINKAFQILLFILLCLPIAGLIAQLFTQELNLFLVFIAVAIGQILMIRFIFIELAFRRLSKRSLSRLVDVLDIESLEKI
ncbi:hypothetical protein [Flavobacterium sp. ov086]|uniref:hypothetical protein n=1 Tax=Flavobacterium sp. ov086 TaxID=1761785 RepID=UPI000B72DE9F|nr:hypothetical protein [Flavobacterium sp. ov086]SNR56884.1 hypothetical protein SAMN04487979_111153 [Flavobacterium sp. ov086]